MSCNMHFINSKERGARARQAGRGQAASAGRSAITGGGQGSVSQGGKQQGSQLTLPLFQRNLDAEVIEAAVYQGAQG